jgi:MFS family permease
VFRETTNASISGGVASLHVSDGNPSASPQAVEPAAEPGMAGSAQGQIVRLGFLFGTLYFIQGIGEPTEGLIAQPVRSLLDMWGLSESQIGVFAMLLSLPWAIKPLFGILTDFVPLWRRRRKSYLVLVNTAALVGLAVLWAAPPQHGSVFWLLTLLLVPTMSVAFADVVVDALMVERGQPLGKTGLLQSVQWACMFAATVVTGVVGGWLSDTGRQDLGFLICATVMVPALALSVFAVREPPYPRGLASPGRAVRQLWHAARTPGVLAVGAFLWLWNFNPFSTSVLQLQMKYGMGWNEQFYGNTVALQAVASVVASVGYGFYCRRLSTGKLMHLSIILGILSTVGYWAMFDQTSAVCISLAIGFTYMTATLIQLDWAARVCPSETAGTVFALLMSLSNLGVAMSMGLGGLLYEVGIPLFGSRTASFNVLVGIGAAFTALCWFLVPALRRGLDRAP